jgi:hypothetical protein
MKAQKNSRGIALLSIISALKRWVGGQLYSPTALLME